MHRLLESQSKIKMQMEKKKIPLSIFFFIFLTKPQYYPCLAQNSPQDYLQTHNTARAQVGVGPMTWDDNLALFATLFVNQRILDCTLIHSVGPFGENLAKGSGDFSGQQAVDSWVQERYGYDYDSNSCFGKDCSHYTQVVWRDSEHLGCARAQCLDGSWFVSCNYDPRGNINGRRPY